LAGTGKEIGRFFKHSSVYALGSIINRIGAFVLLPVYTTQLAVSEYGALEIFYAVSAVASGILAIGIAHATLRFYFEYDNDADKKAVVSTNLIGLFFITVTGVLFISLWQDEILNLVFGEQKYQTGFVIMLATLVLELSSQVSLAYIRAREYSYFFVIVVVVKLIIQVSANIYLVIYREAGVEGILFGNFLAVASGWIVLSGFTIYQCGLSFHKDKFVEVLRYSFPFLLSTITSLFSENIDKFIINGFLGLEALGIYALARKFSMLLEVLIGEPFNRSYGAFRYSIMDREDASEIQSRIVRYLACLLAVAALGLVFFARDLLMFMSSEEYLPAAGLLPILCIASSLLVITYPLQSGILFAKKTRYIFYISVIAALSSALANILLIYYLDIVGAAIAQVCIGLVLVTVTNYFSQKFFKVHYPFMKLVGILFVSSLFFAGSLLLDTLVIYLAIPLKALLLVLFIVVLFKSPVIERTEVAQIRTWVGRYIPFLAVQSAN